MTDEQLVESIPGITPKEALVLIALWRADGKWVDLHNIAFLVWPNEYEGDGLGDYGFRRAINTHVNRLRPKIERQGWRIETWCGFGKYRLLRQVAAEQVA